MNEFVALVAPCASTDPLENLVSNFLKHFKTFAQETANGEAIPIEERSPEEMARCGCSLKKRVAAEGNYSNKLLIYINSGFPPLLIKRPLQG